VTACGSPSPLPDMEAGEVGRVVRVIDGDALVLNTGQSVRLVSIEAPALRPRGREPDSYAVEASRALEDIALGREVQLFYPGLTRDRYDRALAHVVTVDAAGREIWLNREMIVRGAARVRLYPDTAARGAELLAFEREARREARGLWSKNAYQVRKAEDIASDARGVMLVSVVLAEVGDSERDSCLWRLQDATLRIEVEQAASVHCNAKAGHAYEVRGWVSNGRLILSHPLHAEMLE